MFKEWSISTSILKIGTLTNQSRRLQGKKSEPLSEVGYVTISPVTCFAVVKPAKSSWLVIYGRCQWAWVGLIGGGILVWNSPSSFY